MKIANNLKENPLKSSGKLWTALNISLQIIKSPQQVELFEVITSNKVIIPSKKIILLKIPKYFKNTNKFYFDVPKIFSLSPKKTPTKPIREIKCDFFFPNILA